MFLPDLSALGSLLHHWTNLIQIGGCFFSSFVADAGENIRAFTLFVSIVLFVIGCDCIYKMFREVD